MEYGKLYIIATPIGNLEDVTLRGLRILKEADLIACEDTRITKRLLERHSIGTPTISYHQHSKISKIDKIISQIKEGKNVALVTDAGTPGISDPGNVLVAEAVKGDISVVPIPGPSAITALASVAGIDMTRFMFLGYVPHKKGRQTFFIEVAESKYPVIYYDSVHRILKNLELLKESAPEKNVIIGRELTKMFEEIVRGNANEAIRHFSENAGTIKGEFVIIAYEK